MFIAISAQVVLWVGVMVTLAVLSFRRLKFLERQRIVRGYRHHRQLLCSLVVQVAVPYATIILPTAVILVCMTFEVPNATLISQIATQMPTLHSFFNATTMILMTRPYREKLFEWLRIHDSKAIAKTQTSLPSNASLFQRVQHSHAAPPGSSPMMGRRGHSAVV
ncbi:hypothetical protein AAVH_08077 [Aphelenchoides avenae]|nr:hypothetical protein AAVH_08077 [Aphelenchus avenae]